ncbi:MAG: NADase-type glycan-binding domain-containing protein, partial [Acidimicrobiales bacterium]
PAQPGTTAAVQPSAVKPGAARARPAARQKVAPARVINPGDRVCGQCGEGNDPARRFCRRCGASLQQAAVFTLPWYKRFWRGLRRRKVRAAGERPRHRQHAIGGAGGGYIAKWVLRVAVACAIVLAILANVGPYKKPIDNRFTTWYHDVVGVAHPNYSPVHPVGATASSAATGHPATQAIDGASNTSWQAVGGSGQTLTITLEAPTNIGKIGFLIGDQDTPQAYLTEPRPEQITVAFATSPAYSKKITFKDTANFQSYTVDAKKATSLTITIDSVYASPQGKGVSIAEVELFTKT